MKRTILTASTMGFCGGVSLAIKLAEQAAEKKDTVYSYGPMVHNPMVLAHLEELGVKVHKPGEPLPEGGGIMVIRAHGITPAERQHIQDSGFKLMDGTCPKVLKSQKLISRHSEEGYFVVIAGDRGHAEVLGLQGCARECVVISTTDEAEQLELAEKTLLIAQTTFSPGEYEEIGKILKKKCRDLVLEKTICGATDSRQKALEELLPRVEALVVIGGRTSANTTRLYQKGVDRGIPSFLIERPEELDLKALSSFQTIGLTAGASTPNSLIEGTLEILKDF